MVFGRAYWAVPNEDFWSWVQTCQDSVFQIDGWSFQHYIFIIFCFSVLCAKPPLNHRYQMLNKVKHLWIRNESFHFLDSLFSSHATFSIIHLIFPVSQYIILFGLSLGSSHFKGVNVGDQNGFELRVKRPGLGFRFAFNLLWDLENFFSHLSVSKIYNMVSKLFATLWFLSRALPPWILKNK